MAPTKESFTLFLAPWQSRMVKDFLNLKKRKIDRVIIKPGIVKCPMSYKIPFKGLSTGDWILYLTDEQMSIAKERFKLKMDVPSINITDDLMKNGSIAFK